MLMPTSKEFVNLCQAQMALIGDALQADSTAMYLADNWHGHVSLPDLVPVAAYPSPSVAYPSPEAISDDGPGFTHLEAFDIADVAAGLQAQNPTLRALAPGNDQPPLPVGAASSNTEDQLIIPLLYEGTVIGVLTSFRSGKPWQEPERRQWDRLAQTLTLACVLDQRGQWFESRLQHSHETQVQQSQRFHELLHQIRSPLTALKTFGKLLLKRLGSESRHASLTQNMLRESDRIQDLLQYFDSTLKATDHQLAAADSPALLLPPAHEGDQDEADSGATTDTITEATTVDLQPLVHFGGRLQIQHCELPTVLKPALESAAVLFQNEHLELNTTVERDSACVSADPKAIVEIINALLENALKYSGPHTLVWVQIGLQKSQADGQFYGVLVGDTGPGIPQVDQPHVFERNYRGIQAQGQIAGTGLGLAIVQDLVLAMDGYIELFSPITMLPNDIKYPTRLILEERGTVFIVWLPSAEPF